MSNPQPEITTMPAAAAASPPSNPEENKKKERRRGNKVLKTSHAQLSYLCRRVRDCRRQNNYTAAEEDLRHYRPLYQAAVKGDWEAAESYIKGDLEVLMARITSRGETALHVATDFGRAEFIEKLVAVPDIPPEALGIQEHYRGWTALHHAAIYGNLSIVKTLVTKYGWLTEIVDRDKHTPLSCAAKYLGRKEVLRYLILKIPDVLSHPEGSHSFAADVGGYLTSCLISSHSYDICLHLLEKYPFLATAKTEKGGGILSWLAFEPSGFQSGSKLGFWGKYIYQIIPTESHRKPPQSLSMSDLEDQRAKEPPTLPHPAKSYLSHVMRWINGASGTAIEYLVPGIKHIKDEKYKHKCTQKMVDIACEQIASWNEKDIISYFKNWSILKVAAQNGAVELITACFQHFPYLIWHVELIDIAVLHRRERVFNLFLGDAVSQKFMTARYDGEKKENIDGKNIDGKKKENIEDGKKREKENIAHKAARLAPYPQLSSVSCPALQMQRELQWFKAVEKLVNPTQRSFRNKKWETPREIFTTEHRELLKDAERWMKDTSNSCMVVSTLIATVVFAAAFTVPGGNVEGKGIPLFLDDAVFLLFAASDALALFSSTTSILMFLSILTARYAEDDFLRALPKRLILGFASLFLAIATLMVAFGATLYMVLSVRFKWIFIPIIAVTTIPVALYGMLQLPLFIYMVRSTYGSGIFHPKRIW